MQGAKIAGRYELGQVLGSGGMAHVYRGTDRILGRPVAVKVFSRFLDPRGPDRAREEMRTLADLCHPGLVALYDAGTDTESTGEERAFLVMQLVDGPTLAERLRSGPLPEDECRALALDTADALAYVHARGVVHRDVKPANILLDGTGRARIADFGIAQTLGAESMTATGLLMGTVPYLSPEQVRGQQATPASDVFALGLVLMEAWTGRREYPGMSAEDALSRLTRPPVVDPALPGPWPALLTAMTGAEPAARPTAAEVAEAVRRGTYEQPAPTQPVVLPSLVPAARNGRRWSIAGLATATLVAAVAAVALLPRATQTPLAPDPSPAPSLAPVAAPASVAPQPAPPSPAAIRVTVAPAAGPVVTRATPSAATTPTSKAGPPDTRGKSARAKERNGKGR